MSPTSATFHTLPIASRKQTRRFIRSMISGRSYYVLLYCALLSDAITVTARLLPAQIVGWSVDQLIAHHYHTRISTLLWFLIGTNILLIIGLLSGITKYFFIVNFTRDLHIRFIQSVLKIPSPIIEHAGTGDLLSRNSTDTTNIITALNELVSHLCSSILYLGLIIILAVYSSPLLALATLAGLLSFIPGVRWYLRRSRQANLQESTTNSAIYQEMAITVEGAHTIDAFHLQNDRRVALYNSMIHHSANVLRSANILCVLSFTIEIGLFFPFVMWLILAYWGYAHHWFTLGEITTLVLYLLQMIHPIESILTWLDQMQSAYAGFSRLAGIEIIPQKTYPFPLARPINYELTMSQASFYYPHTHKYALKNINLTLVPGEKIAIVGPSGAGKTTLAKLLSGFDFPTSGYVQLGGINLSDMPISQLRHHIMLVTQEHHVFIGTLAENIKIARPSATEEEIYQALADVEATWAQELPLDIMLGDGRSELSAAQAQHIALARVALANPDIVILDEATSLLNPQSAQQAENGISRLFHNKTVIIIAHRLYSAELVDKIVVMDHGEICEIGTHHQLLALGGIFTRLWTAWNTRVSNFSSSDSPHIMGQEHKNLSENTF